MIRRFLCRIGRHTFTDYSVNAHYHEDGTMWMSFICAACLRQIDHHRVPSRQAGKGS